MRELNVYMDKNGSQTLVGTIRGKNSMDAVFSYHDEYLSAGNAAAISISLPLQKEPFNSDKTRTYFENLLPEGFSRTAVADWIKTDVKDYLAILSVLGRECLGAVKIIEGKYTGESEYENIGTVFLYNIDTLHNIFLTVHGTSTSRHLHVRVLRSVTPV